MVAQPDSRTQSCHRHQGDGRLPPTPGLLWVTPVPTTLTGPALPPGAECPVSARRGGLRLTNLSASAGGM